MDLPPLPPLRRLPTLPAQRSLLARLRHGPVLRRIAVVDLKVYRVVRGSARHPHLVRGVQRFSSTGEHAGLWLAVGAIGAASDGDRRGRWGRATASVAGAYLLNTALKGVVRRRRPIVRGLPALISTPTSLSFPSAHASSSFAAARAFSGLLPAPPLYAAAGAMAASRVFLGVHYPTDIVVGAALGTAVGSLGRTRPEPEPEPAGAPLSVS